jgi:eukaryotic-like serine/threonine-protein kinase
MVGKVLAQYQICEKLGEGGMDVVSKARDTHLDRFVALKALPAEKAGRLGTRAALGAGGQGSFCSESPQDRVHLRHRGSGRCAIHLDGIRARQDARPVDRPQRDCLNEALKYAVQIADALAQAHAAGIIHRDLKPSNIIVGENGHVELLDFGLPYRDYSSNHARHLVSFFVHQSEYAVPLLGNKPHALNLANNQI